MGDASEHAPTHVRVRGGGCHGEPPAAAAAPDRGAGGRLEHMCAIPSPSPRCLLPIARLLRRPHPCLCTPSPNVSHGPSLGLPLTNGPCLPSVLCISPREAACPCHETSVACPLSSLSPFLLRFHSCALAGPSSPLPAYPLCTRTLCKSPRWHCQMAQALRRRGPPRETVVLKEVGVPVDWGMLEGQAPAGAVGGGKRLWAKDRRRRGRPTLARRGLLAAAWRQERRGGAAARGTPMRAWIITRALPGTVSGRPLPASSFQ